MPVHSNSQAPEGAVVTAMNLRLLPLSAALYAACIATAGAAETDLLGCAAKKDDAERLHCYDALAGRTAAPMANSVSIAAEAPDTEAVAMREHRQGRPERTYLTRAWNLDGQGRESRTNLTPLRPYRTSYLIVRSSSRPNVSPYSPAPAHTAAAPLDLDALEAKFQFSFKGEIMAYRHIHWLGFEDFRLWGAYTQQSNWQAFNARNSSPFRETNYEPEMIATFGTGNNADGLKMVNLGLSHQSNGKNAADSRSWNRLYLQGGWEWGHDWSVLARGWWRIPENVAKDDNPDITDFVGRADAVIRWEPDNTQSISLLLRNNLLLSGNRGLMQLDWTTPLLIGKSARLHAQLSTGYGESLIDYNHRQTTLGLGVSFREW